MQRGLSPWPSSQFASLPQSTFLSSADLFLAASLCSEVRGLRGIPWLASVFSSQSLDRHHLAPEQNLRGPGKSQDRHLFFEWNRNNTPKWRRAAMRWVACRPASLPDAVADHRKLLQAPCLLERRQLRGTSDVKVRKSGPCGTKAGRRGGTFGAASGRMRCTGDLDRSPERIPFLVELGVMRMTRGVLCQCLRPP